MGFIVRAQVSMQGSLDEGSESIEVGHEHKGSWDTKQVCEEVLGEFLVEVGEEEEGSHCPQKHKVKANNKCHHMQFLRE